jgi:hypothetical protein
MFLSHETIDGRMQSVIRRLPNSLRLWGRIHGRTRGCKWSLLKDREGKYKGNIVEQVDSGGQESCFSVLGVFRIYANL